MNFYTRINDFRYSISSNMMHKRNYDYVAVPNELNASGEQCMAKLNRFACLDDPQKSHTLR